MPANWTFDDDDDEQKQQEQKPAGGLRQHVKSLEAQLKTLQEQNEKYAAEIRKSAVTTAITAKGLDPRVAAFLPADVTSTEDVEKWIGTYGDLFGPKTPATPEGDDESADEAEAELAAQYGQIGRSTAGAVTPQKLADQMKTLQSADLTQAQLLELIQAG